MLIQPSRISRYAHAFIGAVVDADGEAAIDLRTANLRAFVEVWLESAELQKPLRSPSIPASERRAVIASLCNRMAIDKQTRNLLLILSDRHLLHNCPAISMQLRVFCEQRRGIERAHIMSSRELDADQRVGLKAQIEAHGHSKIKMKYTVDPSLLGGIRMQIGCASLCLRGTNIASGVLISE